MATTAYLGRTKKDVTAQMDDLRNLKDGWRDGDGLAPSHKGLDWLEAKLSNEYPDHLPLPRIYPTFEGSVQLEWSIGPNDASLEVNLSDRSGYWHNLNLQTGKDEERLMDLDNSGAWDWLNAKLQRLVESEE